jgi:hypothetical protein
VTVATSSTHALSWQPLQNTTVAPQNRLSFPAASAIRAIQSAPEPVSWSVSFWLLPLFCAPDFFIFTTFQPLFEKKGVWVEGVEFVHVQVSIESANDAFRTAALVARELARRVLGGESAVHS